MQGILFTVGFTAGGSANIVEAAAGMVSAFASGVGRGIPAVMTVPMGDYIGPVGDPSRG